MVNNADQEGYKQRIGEMTEFQQSQSTVIHTFD